MTYTCKLIAKGPNFVQTNIEEVHGKPNRSCVFLEIVGCSIRVNDKWPRIHVYAYMCVLTCVKSILNIFYNLSTF